MINQVLIFIFDQKMDFKYSPLTHLANETINYQIEQLKIRILKQFGVAATCLELNAFSLELQTILIAQCLEKLLQNHHDFLSSRTIQLFQKILTAMPFLI
jgi:hypothetical protein